MQTNNHQVFDYDAVLDARFGAPGTESLDILSHYERFRMPDRVVDVFVTVQSIIHSKPWHTRKVD